MDKQKTGNLIREARVKKNYTQSELGDLLGVSNKAVSRWEKGDSFPDVGILENLEAVLDVHIHDIITGEVGISDEIVVTEVVRVAKLQPKEKNRKAFRDCLFMIAMFFCGISGYSALGNNSIFFSDDSIFVYVILMFFSFVLILVGCSSRIKTDNVYTDKLGKCVQIVSLLSLLWSIFMTWYICVMVINASIPFGIELSLLGPFLDSQLIVLFTINLVMIALELYRYEKKDDAIHWGWFISIAGIYLTVLYGDMLHRMNSAQKVMENLAIRTLVVLVVLAISLGVAKIMKTRANRK